MIQIRAASRLHFGLMVISGDDSVLEHWPNSLGEFKVPARKFGGVGLMVAKPGLSLTVHPARTWQAEGTLADRALDFALRFLDAAPPGTSCPLHLRLEHCAPEHGGLGTGTQLGLAVARACAAAWHLEDLTIVDLANRISRGKRSGLGIHGFAQGGFLVDGGKGNGTRTAPLIAREPFPETWRVVIALPEGIQGMHGGDENRAFANFHPRDAFLRETEALCRLVLLGLLPALWEADLGAFGEALYDFNHRAGAAFASIQGGIYANPLTEKLVSFIRRQGIPGVGQSSWGPAVFAVTPDEDRAAHLTQQLHREFGLKDSEVWITPGCNRGAAILEEEHADQF